MRELERCIIIIITDAIIIIVQIVRLFVHAVSMETKGHIFQEMGSKQ